jgi:hypothetical protein
VGISLMPGTGCPLVMSSTICANEVGYGAGGSSAAAGSTGNRPAEVAPLVGSVGGGRSRALRYALYPSKSILVLYFLAVVSRRDTVSYVCWPGYTPRVVEASRSQRQLSRLLGRAVAAEDGTQARLKLDIVVPAVPLERFVHVIQPIGGSSGAHGGGEGSMGVG